MGDQWVCIGHEISEQLAVQQREYYVKMIKHRKYVRKRTERRLRREVIEIGYSTLFDWPIQLHERPKP